MIGVLRNIQIRFKGTRLDGEKDFYETYFGGGTRGQNVMVSSGDNGNAATPLGLEAMQEVGSTDRATHPGRYEYLIQRTTGILYEIDDLEHIFRSLVFLFASGVSGERCAVVISSRKSDGRSSPMC